MHISSIILHPMKCHESIHGACSDSGGHWNTADLKTFAALGVQSEHKDAVEVASLMTKLAEMIK